MAFSSRKRNRTKRPTRTPFVRGVRVVCAVVLAACLALLGGLAFQQWYQNDAYDRLSSAVGVKAATDSVLTLDDLRVDWVRLSEINHDIVGWVFVPGTPINYPVVKGADDQEYLDRSFDGSTGWFSSKGTLFVSSENSRDLSDRNIVVFGHHMRDGSMFACLDGWKDQAEFDSHRDMFFLTPKGNYRLRTFARFNTTGQERLVRTSFGNEDDFRAYLEEQVERSLVVAPDVDVAKASKTFMFSTCEYSRSDGRAIVLASVVECTNPSDPFVASSDHLVELSSDEMSELGSLD